MQTINSLDLFLGILLGIASFIGFARGFIRELVNLLTWVAAFILANLFSHPLAVMMTHSAGAHVVMNSVASSGAPVAMQSVSHFAAGFAYSLIFIGTMILGSLLGYILNLASYGMGFGLGNRFMGAIFGLIKGMILVLVVIFIAQLTPMARQMIFKKSMMVQICQPAISVLNPKLSSSIQQFKSKWDQGVGEVSSTLQKVPMSPDIINRLSKNQADTEK